MSKKNPKTNNSKFYYLITRNGLELLEILGKTQMCFIANRKNKREYIYKTRIEILDKLLENK